jgi:calcium/calmodulin-dependent protein kinase I
MGNAITLCPTDMLYGEEAFDDMYEVDEANYIGTGKFSVVHLCWRRDQQEKRYALKVINTPPDDHQSWTRIYEEISVMRILGNHPGIIQMVDMDESIPNTMRLVLELCEGGELFDRIQQKKFYPEQEAKVLIKNLLEAVGFIHSKGIMHRDLKPENILLASKVSNTDIKISDFGLAKYSKDYPRRLPRSHSICGSDFYLAPEVIKQEEYGREIDVWSVGVVCYVILSGSLPFFHNVLHKLYRQIVERDLSFPEQAWKSVAKGAQDFILRMLQVRPGDRLTAEQALDHPWLRGAGGKEGSFNNDWTGMSRHNGTTQESRGTEHAPHPLQHPRKI